MYIYIARVGASSLIGMSKKWNRMRVDFFFIPMGCSYVDTDKARERERVVQSNRLIDIYQEEIEHLASVRIIQL